MKASAIAAAAMPLAAAVVIGGALLISHHTAIPPLTPAVQPSLPPAAADSPAGKPLRCHRAKVRTPFAGIAIDPQIGPHVTSFEKATGAHIRVVEFYNAFGKPFQLWEAQQATALGALPLIQLNPRNVSLARIAAGQYDPSIKGYASAVRDFRRCVILSFGHEMNGWWYPWGRPWTTPRTFIAAWRHIHDIFTAEHATNVIWSWDPTHQYHKYRHVAASFASEWYPGNRYVDWVGVDGYLGHGETFAQIFARQLRNIRKVTSKPVFLAETGVAGGSGQVWQIAGLFAALRKYNISGLIWFDLNRKQPWRLEGRPAALAEYRKDVARFP